MSAVELGIAGVIAAFAENKALPLLHTVLQLDYAEQAVCRFIGIRKAAKGRAFAFNTPIILTQFGIFEAPFG